MIAQGTDGLLRGDLTAGVMAGAEMLSFVPLGQSVHVRSPLLPPEVLRWLAFEDGTSWTHLQEEDWFDCPFKEDAGQGPRAWYARTCRR